MSFLKHFPWLAPFLDPTVLWIVGIGTLVLAAATVIGLPIVLTKLPADYFEAPRRPPQGAAGWVAGAAKNLLGFCLLIAGIAMLVLPGQGILTIVVALLLLNFPGKHRLERRIVSTPAVLGAINRFRERAGKPPLRVDPPL